MKCFNATSALFSMTPCLALFCLPLTACGNHEPAPGADVSAGTIIENPAPYVGQTLTVSGNVEDIHGPRAFTMDSGLGVGDLLVLGAEPFPHVPDGNNRAYLVGNSAKVTGVVHMLSVADVEREVGWDLDPQLEIEFEKKPVLIATSSTVAAGAGRPTTPSASVPDPITDIAIIATPIDPLTLVGRRVQVSNVKVQSVAGDRGFWIGAGPNRRLFVRLDETLDRGKNEWRIDIDKGQVRTLSGEIKEVPSAEEIRKQWDLSTAEAEDVKNEQIYLHATQFANAEK